MASDTLQFRLTDSQLRHMEEEGYLIIERLFDDTELQPVIEEISADLDPRCRAAVAAGQLSRTYEEYDFEHRLAHVDAENQEISKSMWDMKVVLPSFFGLMTNPKLLDVAEQLCGPEFDDMAHYLVIPDEELGGRKPVTAPVPKGGVLLLTNRTPHASFENKTDVVRWSMDLRYQSAALPTNAQITRLPGEAKHVGTVGVPLACNPPEPDFLVRSRLRPDQVLKTAEEFVALRKNHVYQATTDRWGYSVAKRKDPLGNPYKTSESTSK
ncbi:MAG: phytanoyl-CoA dioxygenase family protein [Acidobacteriia bacterium]|nr:phytanoyl-CoA dioxygenase family protein [Terriglobia bacterium]